MLERFNAARLATNFSPTRERRELYFASATPGGSSAPPDGAPATHPVVPPTEPTVAKEGESKQAPEKQLPPDLAEHAKTVISDQAESVHAQVAGIVDPEKAKAVMTAAETQKKCLENERMVTEILQMLRQKNFQRHAKEHYSAEEKQMLQNEIERLEKEASQLNQWTKISTALRSWEEGIDTPDDFIGNMTRLYEKGSIYGMNFVTDDEAGKDEIIQKLLMYGIHHKEDIVRWNSLSEQAPQEKLDELKSKKLKMTQDLNGLAKTSQVLSNVQSIAAGWNKSIQDRKVLFEKLVEEAEQQSKHGVSEHDVTGHHHGGFLHDMGITLYSIRNIKDALHENWEAFTHAYHEHEHHKVTALANQMNKMVPVHIGKWEVPYAGGVRVALDFKLEETNNKELNNHKGYLEGKNISFSGLFGDHGEMDTNAHDYNKARGIIEYAASRGWLYDLAEKKGQSNLKLFNKYSWESLMPDYWDEEQRANYLSKILSANAKGQESEIQKGTDKEYFTNKASLFIKAIETEIDRMNFWAAAGIAKRAIDRGLAGEISPWILTTLMRKIRDPHLRKYVNVDVLDEFGKIGLVHSARTLAWAKINRHQIVDWTKKDKMGPLSEAGKFGAALEKIEDVLIKKGEKTGKPFNLKDKEEVKYFDHLSAKLLAGQTVEVREGSGVYASIFEDELYFYPQMLKGQGGSSPDKEDDDYYHEVSDVILSDSGVYGNIFTINGQGKFSNFPKPQKFAETIINAVLPSLKPLPAAERNFREITQLKIINSFNTALIEARSGPASDESFSDEKTPVIMTFITNDLLPYKMLEDRALKCPWGTPPLLADNLIRQLSDRSVNTSGKYLHEARAIWKKKKPDEYDRFMEENS